jgi:MFS family permease
MGKLWSCVVVNNSPSHLLHSHLHIFTLSQFTSSHSQFFELIITFGFQKKIIMSEKILRQPPVLLRWIILLVISLAMMGNYYVYDSINPLGAQLIKELGFSQSGVTLLQAIYSFPNIFMVLIGGIIIDRIGVKKSALLFSLFVMIGAVVTCFKGNLVVMATGRLIFGLGAESMIIAITTTIAHWFKGKQLSFAFGLNLTVARLGTYMAQISPSWAANIYKQGWQHPLFIAASAGILTFVFIGLYFFIDSFSEKRYEFEKKEQVEKIELKKILQFSKSFYFISFLCFIFYAAIFPFTSSIGETVFQHLHHTSLSSAGLLVSIPTLMAMILTPLFGLLADHIGKRSLLMMFGAFLLIPIYLMVAYATDYNSFMGLHHSIHIKFSLLNFDNYIFPNQFIPMFVLGIAFSLVPAVMWPAVALVVEPHRLGTAYGLMTMIQNIGLLGFNLIIGFANDHFHAGELNPHGYIPGLIIFSSCGVLGVVMALFLYRSAKEKGSVNLDKPMKEIH